VQYPDTGRQGANALEYVTHNLIVILAAALAGFLVSLLYMALLGSGRKNGIGFLAFAAFAQFWLAAVLGGVLLLVAESDRSWTATLAMLLAIWVGLVAPPLLVTLHFRGVARVRAAADSLHWLGVLLVQGCILQWLGLRPPF